MYITRKPVSIIPLAALIAGLAATCPAQYPVSAICSIDGDCSVSLIIKYEILTFTNSSAATTIALPDAVCAGILVVATTTRFPPHRLVSTLAYSATG